MAFITRADISGLTFNVMEMAKAASADRRASGKIWVFLSHSHKDQADVEKVRTWLANQGVELYVDWKDPHMSAVTSPETASGLKGKIKECRKFVLLATNNALASLWVPWELGIADSTNGMQNVAIMPVVDTGAAWKGNEYIGIYPRLEKAQDGSVIVLPAGKNTGVSVARWLAQ